MTPLRLLLLCALPMIADAAPRSDHITIDALVVTKAELRRHLSAPEEDAWRPATYADLAATSGKAQPDYLVVRFRTKTPGHYFGEVEARIEPNVSGIKLNVGLHFNRDWVEYFIPLDSYGWPYLEPDGSGKMKVKGGGPTVTVDWNKLASK